MVKSKRQAITGDDTIGEIILKMAEGNPGAALVITQILSMNRTAGIFDLLSMDDMNIRGTQIWVGYKDHCQEDIERFIVLVRERDQGLVDAINAEGRRGNHKEFAVTGHASYPGKRMVMGS